MPGVVRFHFEPNFMPEESRIFPPRMFYLVVWILTLLLALFGSIVSPKPSTIFWVWAGIALIALRQVWVTRWVQVDEEGIRVRNIAQRGRELRWEAISDVQEREVPVRKDRPFRIAKLKGQMESRPGRETTIVIDSDTAGFDALIEIVREKTGGRQDVERAEE